MKTLIGTAIVFTAAIILAAAGFAGGWFSGRAAQRTNTTTATVTVATPEPAVSQDAKILAEEKGISPEAAQERFDTAARTCDVLRDVGEPAVASVCRFNIVNGDPWYREMPPRQIRATSDGLIRATQ
jgi:hypothetical protein